MKQFKVRSEGLEFDVQAKYFTASQSGNVTFYDEDNLPSHFFTYVTRVEPQ